MQTVAATGAGAGRQVILPPMHGAGAASRSRFTARTARPSVLVRAGWFPWLPVWLAAGIGLWFALRFQPEAAHYIAAGLAGAAGLGLWLLAPTWGERLPRLPWRLIDALRLSGLALAVAAAGFGLAGLRSAQVAGPILGWRYYGPVEGRVVEIDRSARDRIRLTLDHVTLRDLPPQRTPRRVRLSLSDPGDDPIPAPGARVMLIGHLGPPPPPSAPGSFDFRRQAWFEGLGAIGYTTNPVLLAAPAPEAGSDVALARLRRHLSAAMQRGIGGQEGAVAAALMTGDRSGIAEATNALMRDANLYHIVSISGLHMSMLAGFVYGALRLALAAATGLAGRGLGWPLHKLAAGVALAAAAFYMALSDGGVATERAFVMVAVMLGAILVDRRAISLRTVALAALILLLLAPDALTQPGFQMSFAATVALILSAEPWARIAARLPRLLRPVAMLLVSSVVAGLATAPLAAAHFNRMSDYGLLANLLAVPVMGAVVMPAGVIAALLGPIGLAQPALWVMGVGTGWMLAVARFVAGLDGAVTAVPAPPGLVLPLLGIGGAVLALSGGAGAVVPKPMTRGIGAALLLAALALWLPADRPAVLIGPQAEAVGLMTPAGRALSRPKGGAFVTGTWLTEDGDGADAAAAAERPGWDGPFAARLARLPVPVVRPGANAATQIIHLSGRGAAAAAAGACTPGRIVVAATEVPTGAGKGGCMLLDGHSLARSGAVAIDARGRIVTVRGRTGTRPWAPQPRPRTGAVRRAGDKGGVGLLAGKAAGSSAGTSGLVRPDAALPGGDRAGPRRVRQRPGQRVRYPAAERRAAGDGRGSAETAPVGGVAGDVRAAPAPEQERAGVRAQVKRKARAKLRNAAAAAAAPPRKAARSPAQGPAPPEGGGAGM